MDARTRREMDDLMVVIQASQASEITLYNRIIEVLELALGYRDWETVVQLKSALHKLADDLAAAHAQST